MTEEPYCGILSLSKGKRKKFQKGKDMKTGNRFSHLHSVHHYYAALHSGKSEAYVSYAHQKKSENEKPVTNGNCS